LNHCAASLASLRRGRLIANYRQFNFSAAYFALFLARFADSLYRSLGDFRDRECYRNEHPLLNCQEWLDG